VTDRAGPRPWTRLAIAGSGAHVAIELGAGVGLPLASVVGPLPAAAGWAAATAAGWRAAGQGGSRRDTVLRVVDGTALAAVAAHWLGWPRRRRGLPWLTRCEGLEGGVMVPYNAVLAVTAVGAVAGLVRENRSAGRAAGLAPLALVPALVRVQHREHAALVAAAHAHPAWWNRRLARSGDGPLSARGR
jgi:hypothetical protein